VIGIIKLGESSMPDEPLRPALTTTSGSIAWPKRRRRFPEGDHPTRCSSTIAVEE
jgi:hypothetical protein